MTSISITWHIRDDKACPICKQLNEYTWTFVTGQNQFPGQLVHPQFGVVWDIARGSAAHGYHKETCRCSVEPSFDLSDLLLKVHTLYGDLLAQKE